MSVCTPQNRTVLEKLHRIRSVITSDQEDWREAKRIYDEFKALRASIGKPVDNKMDAKKIRKDLSSDDFLCPSCVNKE